ncbi:hypothetical protein IU500_24670 [Nocardia terpenica]|uniref:hypothetical protein n=1 Tax=Nocardia terpenica TaxID=455432 RepID=UPI001892D92F|nr:hypothetical protein [Nocardia terpenica]MBF6064695.1 hypothetical protein [Nocardia terpenica]MBF6107211.1 hypothetical protein [Nocardia terpenica]MBF6114969.1 hypothetical protein [Nocardia terpenica]MBF6122074.1 hypothetical protein [Nocardia terpenica]MBF6154457.1 hypothetical protein [Nocardia terpenica]
MTEIDDITQQLTQSAAHALRAAQHAVERHRQRTTREREEARRESEHRLRVFETQLRTAILQQREAAREGNALLATELKEIEHQQRTDELIARWAAAEAHRDTDPGQADAWTARLREAGISPDVARARADEFAQEPWDNDEAFEVERLAADYTDKATDFADQRAHIATEIPDRSVDVEDGAETTRLIGIAQPADRSIGPANSGPTQVPPASRVVGVDYAADL